MDLLAQAFDLIVCDGTAGDPCTFAHLIELVQELIKALVFISTFLATAVFAYAGILLISSGGSEAKKDQAKKMITKVLIGYLWILAAWVVVYTITSILLNDDYTLLKPR